ncbi:hypothetical protein IV203_025726 [Nitzschia inconspicua]|uniref:Uncharacterized protein n=1 Tax=Nitzschia inconspicua TaxID=303405 RepID=A0A9K3LGR0_9STRA|nr:hypothetical protein IV203_025726 [Nitzschia inconspicua]
MRSTVFLVSTLLIITSPHDSHARLIGTRWSSNKKLHVSTPTIWNIAEAGPVSNKEVSDTNDKMIQQQQQQQGSANSRPILTGSRLFLVDATPSFEVDKNENSADDACYDCCCDRNVVCNSPHGKSEATCHRNACKDGATCQSKGYTCPSYNCEDVETMW